MIELENQQTYHLEWFGPALLCAEEIVHVPGGISGVYLACLCRKNRRIPGVLRRSKQ